MPAPAVNGNAPTCDNLRSMREEAGGRGDGAGAIRPGGATSEAPRDSAGPGPARSAGSGA
jgi:hypothetical protein